MKKIFIVLFGLAMALQGAKIDRDIAKKVKFYEIEPIPTTQDGLLQLIKNQCIQGCDDINEEVIELGNMLFHDKRLSKNGDVSCASCHDLNMYGTDGRSVAIGNIGKKNPNLLNSPTVFNSIFNHVQTWDGRAMDVKIQMMDPFLNDFEMANTPENVEKTIKSIPGYAPYFQKAFGEKPNFENVIKAIAIFEKTLVVSSRVDKYLNGDLDALSDEEKRVFLKFLTFGCASCHNGRNFGGKLRNFEVFDEYRFRDIGNFKGNENKQVKAPSLRGVKYTKPYFHNGMIGNLDEAVGEMARIQLGIDISDNDKKDLVDFLDLLSPKYPRRDAPILPK